MPSNPSNPSNPPAAFRRPFQSNCRSYTPQPSFFQGVEALFACRQTLQILLFPRQLSQLHAPAICFRGRSRLPFARLQTPKTRQTLQTLQTLQQASSNNSHLFLRAFKPAVCLPSNAFKPFKPFNLPAHLSKATLAATRPSQRFKLFRRPFQGNSRSYTPQPSVLKGVQDCRLPVFKPLKPFRKPPATIAICWAFKPAVCLPSNAFKPFKPFKPSRRLSAGRSKATVAATRPSHLFFRALRLCLHAVKHLNSSFSKATLAATRPSHLL